MRTAIAGGSTGSFLAVAAILIGLGGSAMVWAQVLPPFGRPDAGGMPSNLREVAALKTGEFGDPFPAGVYDIWTARKIPSVPPQQWKWAKTRTFDFRGGLRYTARIGFGGGLVVYEFLDRRYPKPGPNEAVLQLFDNGNNYDIGVIVTPATGTPAWGTAIDTSWNFSSVQSIRVVETCGERHWDAVWTRQGNSNLFDAVWDVYDGNTLKAKAGVRDVIEFTGISGNRITFHRRGNNGNYFGNLSADHVNVIGAGTSWYAAGCSWSGELTSGPPVSAPAAPPATALSGSGVLDLRTNDNDPEPLMRIRYEISGATITKSTDRMDTVNKLSGERTLDGIVGQGTLRITGTAHNNPTGGNWAASMAIQITRSDSSGRTVVKEFSTRRPTAGDIPFDVSAPIESRASYTISVHYVGSYNYAHTLDISGSFGTQK